MAAAVLEEVVEVVVIMVDEEVVEACVLSC